ncbi:hypothetical protein ABK040_010606 [Willaertia magna]
MENSNTKLNESFYSVQFSTDSFPSTLLNTDNNTKNKDIKKINNRAEEKVSNVKVKHLFTLQNDVDSFLKYFEREQEQDEELIEIYVRSLFGQDKWIKKVINCKDNTFYFKETVISELGKNEIQYRETNDQSLENLFKESDNNLIKLLIQRRKFTFIHNRSIKLHFDLVEFPKGDIYTVFSIFCDVPNHKEMIEYDTINEIQTIPSRSKIIEYLFRHDREIYDKLIEEKKVPDLNYSSKKVLYIIDGNHSQSITKTKEWTVEALNESIKWSFDWAVAEDESDDFNPLEEDSYDEDSCEEDET